MEPRWLGWGRRLQAIAQNGLELSEGGYDRLRYAQVREIAAELLAAGAGAEPAAVVDLFARERGYATPKVDVRGAVFRDGRVLLVREAGLWTLPGGWADVEDSPSEAVEREVLEESGYRTEAAKLLAVYDRSKHPHVPLRPWRIYKLFFRCDLVPGAERAPLGGETDAAEFFPPDTLPELDLGRVTPGQLARLFAHHAHPDWPPDFD